MYRVLSLSIIVIAAIAIVVTAIMLYKLFYNKRINKQLHDKTTSPIKLMPPRAFAIITVFIVLLTIVAVTTYMAFTDPGGIRVPEEYRTAVYDYQDFSADRADGYRGLYSIDDNPGYTKTVEKKGDLIFTCFIRTDTFDYYHPAFIVFAEYIGTKAILHYGVQGDFYAPNDLMMSGYGHAGSAFRDYVCVYGTSTIESRLELSIYLYDTNGIKGEEKGDYAAAEEMIIVQIPSAGSGAIRVS